MIEQHSDSSRVPPTQAKLKPSIRRCGRYVLLVLSIKSNKSGSGNFFEKLGKVLLQLESYGVNKTDRESAISDKRVSISRSASQNSP